MSLKHEFLVQNPDVKNCITEELVNVDIDDCIILYIKDSLNWVQTYWNKNKSEKNGLNYYGITIIRGNSLKHFRTIILCWMNLFNEAPEEFFLTGGYILNNNKYEKLKLRKKDVLYQLEKLVDICNQSIDQEKPLLHKGI